MRAQKEGYAIDKIYEGSGGGICNRQDMRAQKEGYAIDKIY